MSWFMFGLVKELTDPYTQGFNAGREQAMADIKRELPMLIRLALEKLNPEANRLLSQSTEVRYRPELVAIDFRIYLRNKT